MRKLENMLSKFGKLKWRVKKRIRDNGVKYDVVMDKELVYDMYWNKLMSLEEIADEFGVRVGTVIADMKINGIHGSKRDRIVRSFIIKYGGLYCYVCGFDFYEFYGELGRWYIVIHHIRYNFKSEEEELGCVVPVCANCHGMIHRHNVTPEYLREYLKKL